METQTSGSSDTDEKITDGELTDFLSLLNEFKATGCNLLVVGEARPGLFARASTTLLGDPESLRYRLLAVTDTNPRSVTDRFPSPVKSPRPLSETAKIVEYAARPRSTAATSTAATSTAATSTDSAGVAEVPQRCVADSDLDGLATALIEGIEEFGRHTADLKPATVRVGVDSVDALLDHHGEDDVREWFQAVGESVCGHDAMAHYVLRDAYESDHVRALEDAVDAVIEIRSVDPEVHGHDAQQRWHVPGRDLTMGWVRL